MSGTVKSVLKLLEDVVPTLTERYRSASHAGSSVNAHRALADLHRLPKEVETTVDSLMVSAL